MGIVIVEVCESNFISQLNLESLEALYPGVSVLRTDCLSKCGVCQYNAYAYVNGQIVFAKDVQTCFERIQAKVEEELTMLTGGAE